MPPILSQQPGIYSVPSGNPGEDDPSLGYLRTFGDIPPSSATPIHSHPVERAGTFKPDTPGHDITLPSTLTPKDITYPHSPAILGDEQGGTVAGNETVQRLQQQADVSKVIMIGAEYNFLKTKLSPEKKKKPLIDPSIADDEINYIWANRHGTMIYTPMYEAYRQLFWENVKDEAVSKVGTRLKYAFENYKDTSVYSRYMQNAAQFSSAKNASEVKLMQQALVKDGKVASYGEFKKASQQIAVTVNQVWQNTEYETQRHTIVGIQQWEELLSTRDYYGFWSWEGVMDNRERQDHVEMEGKTFKIGDPAGDACWPPGDFNCFHGDMLVRICNGMKRIADIQAGEIVLTRSGHKKVLRSWCNGHKKVHKVVIEGSDYICTFYSTINHKIYTKENGFIEISELHPSEFYTFTRSDLSEFVAQVIIHPSRFETDVYDLMIEEEPEFFVNNILVHNCRCIGAPSDDDTKVVTGEQARELLNTHIAEGFRTNAYYSGSLPANGSSYFQVVPSANSLSGADYSGMESKAENSSRVMYKAKGLHEIANVYHEWKQDYHSDHDSIIFQNAALTTNITFDNNAFHAIAKHSKGFDELPETLENPTEVWGYWSNADEQMSVVRHYIKGAYMVITVDDEVVDAYLFSASSINSRRKGCLLFKKK